MALLFVVLVAFFVVLFLFLLPILFSLQAVGSLFVYPRQLKAILGNKILRRNHALEHATIVVMMEREPGRKLNGFSTDDGFFVQGVRSIAEVESAAREASRGCKRGERARHPPQLRHDHRGGEPADAVFFLAPSGSGCTSVAAVPPDGRRRRAGLRPARPLKPAAAAVRHDRRGPLQRRGRLGRARKSRAICRSGIFGFLLAASTVRVRVFHTDPDAVEIIRDDGAIVR